MNKKPSFLFRGWSRLRDRYALLGRKEKSGGATDTELSEYSDLGEHLRDVDTAKRHAMWQTVYDDVYHAKQANNLTNGMKPKKAKFQAHLTAQAAVANKFSVTIRAVQKAIITYD